MMELYNLEDYPDSTIDYHNPPGRKKRPKKMAVTLGKREIGEWLQMKSR